MLLTEEERGELSRRHGVWVSEACDKCGKPILDSVTWTRRGKPEVFCSQVCRDGVAHTPGECELCGTVLDGKRRGTRFCGSKCRKRFVRDPHKVGDGRNIADTDLADSTGYEAQKVGVAMSVSPRPHVTL